MSVYFTTNLLNGQDLYLTDLYLTKNYIRIRNQPLFYRMVYLTI